MAEYLENEIDVSIILVNYNNAKITFDCIDSIIQKTSGAGPKYEIIVVDNGSKPEICEALKIGCSKYKSRVKLILSRVNTGFAGGNMIGAGQSRGKYLYFLNNDCLLINDAVSALYSFMEANRQAGVATSTMYNIDNKLTVSVHNYPSALTAWLGSRILTKLNKNRYPNRKIKYELPIKIQVATGASMFVRADAFFEIGGFDTNYFLYCEEEDLCIRLAKAGYQAYLEPKAEIKHLCGKSTQQSPAIKREYYISLWYYLSKHCHLLQRWLVKLRYFLRELFGAVKKPSRLLFVAFMLRGCPMAESLRHKTPN